MELFGFVVINDLEAQTMGLINGVTGFDDAYKELQTLSSTDRRIKNSIGNSLNMNDEEKFVSFMNNYFIFKKVRHIESTIQKPKKRRIKLTT